MNGTCSIVDVVSNLQAMDRLIQPDHLHLHGVFSTIRLGILLNLDCLGEAISFV